MAYWSSGGRIRVCSVVDSERNDGFKKRVVMSTRKHGMEQWIMAEDDNIALRVSWRYHRIIKTQLLQVFEDD